MARSAPRPTKHELQFLDKVAHQFGVTFQYVDRYQIGHSGASREPGVGLTANILGAAAIAFVPMIGRGSRRELLPPYTLTIRCGECGKGTGAVHYTPTDLFNRSYGVCEHLDASPIKPKPTV